ncbi:MAG: acyl carrier protein [Chitinophagaceae bacterium]|nr:acyl carrier protein [Oligoflexus sp.]
MKATAEKIRQEMAKVLHLNIDAIKDEYPLKTLVAESFLLIELVIELQDTFDIIISQDELPKIETVANLIEMIISKSK